MMNSRRESHSKPRSITAVSASPERGPRAHDPARRRARSATGRGKAAACMPRLVGRGMASARRSTRAMPSQPPSASTRSMSRRKMSSTARDAGLARDREAPKMRPPDQAGRGAERHRLDHVAAAPDAAVDQHRDAAFDRLGHGRQSADRGDRAVQLAAAVVGDDHAVDAVIDRGARLVRMQDALQEQRPRPDLAQPGDIAPAQRRVEQVVDVPASERMSLRSSVT